MTCLSGSGTRCKSEKKCAISSRGKAIRRRFWCTKFVGGTCASCPYWERERKNSLSRHLPDNSSTAINQRWEGLTPLTILGSAPHPAQLNGNSAREVVPLRRVRPPPPVRRTHRRNRAMSRNYQRSAILLPPDVFRYRVCGHIA